MVDERAHRGFRENMRLLFERTFRSPRWRRALSPRSPRCCSHRRSA